jgi:hypothetical protein
MSWNQPGGWAKNNGWYMPAVGGGGFTPTSTQSANFLTRVGVVTGTGSPTYGMSTHERNAVDALITGIVTDLGGNTSLSTWPILDALYVLATTSANARAVALLNLVGNVYNCVEHTVGATQFTADQGYTGVNGGYLDTTFDPTAVSGQNWSQNSATFAGYSHSTIASDQQSMGGNGSGTLISRLYPYFGGAAFLAANNSALDAFAGSGKFYGASRNGASNIVYYIDATNSGITARASAAPAGPTLVLLGDSTLGSNTPFLGILSAAFIGGGMSVAQMGALNTRLSTYMAAVP